MEKSNRQRHKPLFACFLILSILFAYTLHLRSPYFGKMADGIFEDQTARTLKFAKNWYRDGILNDRFLQIENPDSIEFSSLEQRKPYVSFLPGTVVPVYILSKITQSEPTIEIVHGYNLASQYMCALLLAGIAWVLGAFTSNWHRIIAALLAGSFYILNPFLIYNHQQIFYSDAALMLPLLSFIFIQSLKLCYNVKGFKINFALAVSMFCLVFTDWYGLFIAFMWGLFRLSDEKLSIRNRIMELRVLAIPIFLCLIFF